MRNHGVDTARGLAIAVMVFANAAPYVFPGTSFHLTFRLLFSLAAPTFIFLSGYTLQLNLERGRPARNLITRALQVLAVGVFVDGVCSGIVPFETFDVLYLIGSSLLILLALRKASVYAVWGLLAASLTATILLHARLVYRFENPEHALSLMNLELVLGNPGHLMQRFLYDGWFPLFPWLAVAIAGNLFRRYEPVLISRRSLLLFAGLTFLIMALAAYLINPSVANPPREGYLELFYPVQHVYWMALAGVLLIAGACCMLHNFRLPILTTAGTQSLFVYFLHSFLIQLMLVPMFYNQPESGVGARILAIVLFAAGILAVTPVVHHYRNAIRQIKWLRPLSFLTGF